MGITCIAHLCNQQKLHPDPFVFLNNQPLSVAKEVKILGLYFDNKRFATYQYLKTKCL